MIRRARILAVDDEETVLESYHEVLDPLGWELHAVTTYVEAVDRLTEGDWGVVLVDLNLRGAGGPNEGLGLIEEINQRSPGAESIVVTGYASPESIERAFEAGAYDYIEKTPSFRTLLRVKVEHAMELQRQRWLAHTGDDKDRSTARELLAQVRREPNVHRKGRLLEDLLELMLRSVQGFFVTPRRKGLDEEFDLVVRLDAIADPFWQREGQYFLVECKNWSRPVDPKELDRFAAKLERRFGRVRLGFFVAVGGFTEGFRSTLATMRKGTTLVVPLDSDDLERLVEAESRSDVLKALHQRTIEIAADK